jgi:hypothetical protein
VNGDGGESAGRLLQHLAESRAGDGCACLTASGRASMCPTGAQLYVEHVRAIGGDARELLCTGSGCTRAATQRNPSGNPWCGSCPRWWAPT